MSKIFLRHTLTKKFLTCKQLIAKETMCNQPYLAFMSAYDSGEFEYVTKGL